MSDGDRQDRAETCPSFQVDGSRLTPVVAGADRLAALIALIDGADRDLRLISYIFAGDTAGGQVRDALIAATRRGVTVSLLIDGFGSEGTPDAFFAPLRAAGASVCRFLPRFGRRYLLRNHQKLALADEATALIGGFNIADAYFGETPDSWRDFAMRVDGPAAAALAGYYDALLAWARDPGSTIRALARLVRAHSGSSGPLRWLHGGPTRRLNPWARALRRDMIGAYRIDVAAAYFAPNPGTLRRLGRAARTGTVRILTAARSDNGMTIAAARNCYVRLLRRGARIWEYQPMRLHTKIFVIDAVGYVGSANFDVRSLYLNLEIMLRVDDARFADWLRGHIAHDIAQGQEANLARIRRVTGWMTRIKWRLAYFVVAAADYTVARRVNVPSGGREIG